MQSSNGQLNFVLLLCRVELASYDKFSFSTPDLDGNKLAKGMCLVRIKKCLSSGTKGRQFFCFELSRRRKG